MRVGLTAPAGLLLGEQSSPMNCEYVWLRSWETFTEIPHFVSFSKLLLLIHCVSFPLFKGQKPGHLLECTSKSSGTLPESKESVGFVLYL